MANRLLTGHASALRAFPGGSPPYPAGTALHALHHGTTAAAQADTFDGALAAASAHGQGPTIVAGAMFGATHGIHALPGTRIAELELGWVADRLARDAYTELTFHPSESNGGKPPDSTWWPRCPGW